MRTNQTGINPQIGEIVIIRRVGDDACDSKAIALEICGVKRRSLETTWVSEAHSGSPIPRGWGGFAVQVTLARPGGIYFFHATLRARHGRGRAPVIGLDGIADVRKVQRRRLYRLPLSVRTRIWMGLAGPPLIGALPSKTALIVNLSAGGALLSVPKALIAGEVIAVDVPLGADGSPSPLRASVISCEPSPAQDGEIFLPYAARVEFDNGSNVTLPAEMREEIVQYIFARQRILLSVRKLMSSGGTLLPSGKKRARILSAIAERMRAPLRGWKL